MSNELRMITVSHDATDGELRRLVRQTSELAKVSNDPFYLAIDGYDSDPREIWQIPAAVSLCKRMTKLGMMSSLVPGDPFKNEPLPGLTALQLWLVATDRLANGVCEITREVYETFYHDLLRSNVVADSIPPDDGDTFAVRVNICGGGISRNTAG